MPLLYDIPRSLLADIDAGKVELFNAILKDVATGRIVGHVQQTNALEALLGSAFQGAQVTLSNGFSPLGLVSAFQNEQIRRSLGAMKSTLGLLQNLQIGALALSGVGLGISVAGFALMLRRLKGIDAQLNALESKVEGVTRDRRQDEVRTIIADVGSDLEMVETIGSRRDPMHVAETAQMSLSRSAGRLEAHFARIAPQDRNEPWTEADLEMLWSLAAAIRLCHEAGARALYVIDDVRTAGELSRRQAGRLLELCRHLSPDSIARTMADSSDGVSAGLEKRRRFLPVATTLVTGIRGTVEAVAAQVVLTEILIKKEISGPAYLEAVAQETDKPLLYLPA